MAEEPAHERPDHLASAHTAGERHLRDLLGDEATTAFQARLTALHPDFERHVTAFVFGVVRDQSPLDRRTQALCVLATLVATGGAPQLAANTRYALAAGATVAEIEAVIVLATPFAGFPAAWNALAAVRPVLDETMGADSGGPSV